MSSARRAGPAVTVVSPHFDDAPLSLGQSMRDGALRQASVTVRVVFGRTNWTTFMHPSPGRAGAVGVLRRIEETAASWSFGYRWQAAGWEESILRTGELDAAAILDADADLSAEPLVEEVREWLRALCDAPLRGPRPELLLAPAGLGGHVDHRIVALAAAGLVGALDTPVAFFEDRPYASYLSPDERRVQLDGLGLELVPTAASGPIRTSTQRRARRCYPSQIVPYFSDVMGLDTSAGAREVVWSRPGDLPEWWQLG